MTKFKMELNIEKPSFPEKRSESNEFSAASVSVTADTQQLFVTKMQAVLKQEAEPNTVNFFKGYEARFEGLKQLTRECQDEIEEMHPEGSSDSEMENKALVPNKQNRKTSISQRNS